MGGFRARLQAQQTPNRDLMQPISHHQRMMKSMTTILSEVCFLQGMDAAAFLHLNQRDDCFEDPSLL